MNFLEAMMLIKEGNKVRMKHWEKHEYIYSNDNNEVCWSNGNIVGNIPSAGEWELYDDDMSRIYLENNEIKVVLLVENKEDYLNVAFAYAKDNPYAFPYMIGDAYIKAREL